MGWFTASTASARRYNCSWHVISQFVPQPAAVLSVPRWPVGTGDESQEGVKKQIVRKSIHLLSFFSIAFWLDFHGASEYLLRTDAYGLLGE